MIGGLRFDWRLSGICFGAECERLERIEEFPLTPSKRRGFSSASAHARSARRPAPLRYVRGRRLGCATRMRDIDGNHASHDCNHAPQQLRSCPAIVITSPSPPRDSCLPDSFLPTSLRAGKERSASDSESKDIRICIRVQGNPSLYPRPGRPESCSSASVR